MGAYSDTLRAGVEAAISDDNASEAIFLLANYLRSRNIKVSREALAAMPVDEKPYTPVRNTVLTKEEISAFKVHDMGWHLIALCEQKIIFVERFPWDPQFPEYLSQLNIHLDCLLAFTEAQCAHLFAAYHLNGLLKDWQTIPDFAARSKA